MVRARRQQAPADMREVPAGSTETLSLLVAWPGCALSTLGGFQNPAGQSPEQSGWISQQTLLGAGAWTRDLLRSLLA